MRNWRNALVVLVVCAATATSASAQQELKWKFKKGDKFYQETAAAMKQTITISGQVQNQDLEQVTISSFSVEQAPPDGNLILEQKVESVRISGSAPLGAAQKAMDALQGTTFKITLGDKYQVTVFDGYEDFLKKVGGDDPLVGKMVRTTMSQDTLKKAIEESFTFLGSDPRKPGSEWKRDSTLSLGPLGTIISSHTYTYEGNENRNNRPMAKIGVTANLTYQAPKGEAASGLNFQITKGELKTQSAKGTIWFDNSAGRLAESEMRMHLKGTLTVSANGQDFPMDLNQEQVVRVRLTDQPPLPPTK